MNDFTRLQVSIDDIDFDDRSYIITFGFPTSQMIESIQKVGLQNPPILEQKSSSRFRIISGLKRILALKHLNQMIFPAHVHLSDNDDPDLKIFLFSFYENRGTRDFNLIEKANFLHQLIHLFGVAEKEVVHEFLPLLGLGKNQQVLERYLRLVELEEHLKIAVAELFVTVDQAISLLSRTKDERLSLFELFQKLKLGTNRQKEFFKVLSDLAAMIEQPIDLILAHESIQRVLTDDRLTPVVKTDRIKEYLFRLRFPRFARAEEDFQSVKKDLKLPPSIVLHPPPFFESEKYKMEFSFKNEHEFKCLVDILQTIVLEHKLEKLTTLV